MAAGGDRIAAQLADLVVARGVRPLHLREVAAAMQLASGVRPSRSDATAVLVAAGGDVAARSGMQLVLIAPELRGSCVSFVVARTTEQQAAAVAAWFLPRHATATNAPAAMLRRAVQTALHHAESVGFLTPSLRPPVMRKGAARRL